MIINSFSIFSIITFLNSLNPDIKSTWRLVFSDEFSGNSLNTKKWEYQEGCSQAFGNGNLQCYVPGTNNINLANGTLTITSKIENVEDKNYTSGRFRQRGVGFKYGFYVVRGRLPKGNHLWPAFWLLTREDNCYQEIDIMEAKGNWAQRIVFTAHYGFDFLNLVRHGTGNNTYIDFSKSFHNYGILWTKDKLAWYIDDVKYYETSLDRSNWKEEGKKQCSHDPFSQKMKFIVNMAVGGTFFNSTPFPVEEAEKWEKPTLEVDWIRIFQQKPFIE